MRKLDSIGIADAGRMDMNQGHQEKKPLFSNITEMMYGREIVLSLQCADMCNCGKNMGFGVREMELYHLLAVCL